LLRLHRKLCCGFERGDFSTIFKFPIHGKSDTVTIETVLLEWVYILDKNLTRHEQNMKTVGGFTILEIYRTWEIHKCCIDTLLDLQMLPEGTELEVVLRNPRWKLCKKYPSNTTH